MVYVCFLKGASAESVEKLVKAVLGAKLSEGEFGAKRVSILDLPGDILVVPQATLGQYRLVTCRLQRSPSIIDCKGIKTLV